MTDTTSLSITELEAERNRLTGLIRAAKLTERERWNTALDACENALDAWLTQHAIDGPTKNRKNAVTWDIDHGMLTVTFVYDDKQYGAGSLQVRSERDALTLTWSQVPAPERLVTIIATLLSRDTHAELRAENAQLSARRQENPS
jgi:hypothetical protein